MSFPPFDVPSREGCDSLNSSVTLVSVTFQQLEGIMYKFQTHRFLTALIYSSLLVVAVWRFFW